jgi:RNA polymerase sigma-70 factor (ECF subfamily)
LRKKRPQVSIDQDGDEYDAEIAGLAAPEQDDSATVSVNQVLDQLPERYRQAVTLFYMEDKSYEQTAESLGLPLGTVKALLHRARKRLIDLTRETVSE